MQQSISAFRQRVVTNFRLGDALFALAVFLGICAALYFNSKANAQEQIIRMEAYSVANAEPLTILTKQDGTRMTIGTPAALENPCFAQEWGNILVATSDYGLTRPNKSVAEAKSVFCPGGKQSLSAQQMKERGKVLLLTLKRAKEEFDEALKSMPANKPFPLILAQSRFTPLLLIAEHLAE